MDDNVGIAGYYWGTSSSYRFNSFSVSGKEARLSVNTAGIYYVTALDTNGNLSDTQSVTFYKTILNANGGSVSLKSVLTQAGKSFEFKAIPRCGPSAAPPTTRSGRQRRTPSRPSSSPRPTTSPPNRPLSSP